jgi:exopolysaccharide/PEP-CTERM locus tyrosine autokinase
MSRIEEALSRAAGLKSGERLPEPSREAQPGAPGRSPMADIGPVSGLRLPEETMVVINDPLSPMAEEYRKLKESLVKVTRRERFDNLIAVTSATVGEGKSMTSVNLAACLASEFDHTVLLVDADLRRPTVHRYLNFESAKGLSDCLREGLDVGQVMIKTGIGKLSVLQAGTPVANPVELFTSEAMRHLFLELKNRYPDRYIIVDTPPVLPFAETRSIASFADGILLVVREGQPTPDQVRDSIEALDNKVLGIVYNGAQINNRAAYYYYGNDYRAE